MDTLYGNTRAGGKIREGLGGFPDMRFLALQEKLRKGKDRVQPSKSSTRLVLNHIFAGPRQGSRAFRSKALLLVVLSRVRHLSTQLRGETSQSTSYNKSIGYFRQRSVLALFCFQQFFLAPLYLCSCMVPSFPHLRLGGAMILLPQGCFRGMGRLLCQL